MFQDCTGSQRALYGKQSLQFLISAKEFIFNYNFMQKSDHMYLTGSRKQTFKASVFKFLFMCMDLCEHICMLMPMEAKGVLHSPGQH